MKRTGIKTAKINFKTKKKIKTITNPWQKALHKEEYDRLNNISNRLKKLEFKLVALIYYKNNEKQIGYGIIYHTRQFDFELISNLNYLENRMKNTIDGVLFEFDEHMSQNLLYGDKQFKEIPPIILTYKFSAADVDKIKNLEIYLKSDSDVIVENRY